MQRYLFASVASLLIGGGVSFQHKQRIAQQRRPSDSSRLFETSTIENNDTSVSTRAMELKRELIALSESTNRGFRASRVDRNQAKKTISELAKLNPSPEPAAAYYLPTSKSSGSSAKGLAGKWTLVYTDAPDITSLDATGPLSTAKLGRVGQQCDPPRIANVIEWTKPDWASDLPFSGSENSRVLQKVVCEGSASPSNPSTVDLKILGLELEGEGDSGPASILGNNPVKLQGPLSAPFGKFDILYLDETMRITKTYQGFYAVNLRDDEWF